MKRNGGATIDSAARRVLDRDRKWYEVDELQVAEHGLYYRRPIQGPGLLWYHERWLLPAQGWVLNRFAFRAPRTGIDWYIEPDVIEVEDHLWHVRDGYLDLFLDDGRRYHVDDADEFASAIAGGHIPLQEAVAVLHAFDRLCDALRGNGCSGAELLREYAPSLPASALVRGADGMLTLANGGPASGEPKP